MPADAWRTVSEPYRGGVLVLRYNEWAKRLRGHPRYRNWLSVEMPYESEGGLPRPSDSRLATFEKFAREVLCRGEASILVAVIDAPMRHEWWFYTKHGAGQAQQCQTFMRERNGDLRFMTKWKVDRGWRLFRVMVR